RALSELSFFVSMRRRDTSASLWCGCRRRAWLTQARGFFFAWCLGTAVTAWAREGAPEVVRVVHYNLRNWLTQERDRNGERLEKPEAEKAEAVSLLVKAAPDVLSVCEIGTEEDVADLK